MVVAVVAEAHEVKEDEEGEDDRVADALSEAKLVDIPMQDEGETNLRG